MVRGFNPRVQRVLVELSAITKVSRCECHLQSPQDNRVGKDNVGHMMTMT